MTTTLTLNSIAVATPKAGGNGLLERLIEWLRVNRSIRQTVRELNQLSDYELDDLGIARCDIPGIARKAALSR